MLSTSEKKNVKWWMVIKQNSLWLVNRPSPFFYHEHIFLLAYKACRIYCNLCILYFGLICILSLKTDLISFHCPRGNKIFVSYLILKTVIKLYKETTILITNRVQFTYVLMVSWIYDNVFSFIINYLGYIHDCILLKTSNILEIRSLR